MVEPAAPSTETTADGGRRIRLSKPLISHSLEIMFLDLRPPRWSDYMTIGDPVVQGFALSGLMVEEPVIDRLRQYAERLIKAEQAEFLPQLSLADTKEVIGAIRSFFTEAQDARRTASPLSEAAG